MDHIPPDHFPSRGHDAADILEQVSRHLSALDRWEEDIATQEDLEILSGLIQAARAAMRKGYSEDLLVHVLRSLFQTPPESS